MEECMKLNLSEIFQRIVKLKDKKHDIRHGQAVYLVVYDMFPEQTKQLTATEYDCYHDDKKVDKFLLKIMEILKKENQHGLL